MQENVFDELNDSLELGNSDTALAAERDKINIAKDKVKRERKKAMPYTQIDEQGKELEEYRTFFLANRKHFSETELLADFRKQLATKGITWNPHPKSIYAFHAMWERQEKMAENVAKFDAGKPEVIRTAVTENQSLEQKLESFAGILLADAERSLDVSEQEDDAKIMIERKKYAMNVTKILFEKVQKDKIISLKVKKDNREGIGLLAELMNKARAGEISTEHLNILAGKTT